MSRLLLSALMLIGSLCAQRGNIGITQIKSADRKGNGAQLQVFGGGSTTNGHMATYDANGNIIDGGAPAGPTTNQNIRQISFYLDGGGSALAAKTVCTHVNYGGTIQAFTMISDVSGNATVDVKTVAFASYTGPASASSITDSHTPAMTGATSFQDTTLTSWTTTLSAGSVVCFVLSSPATITQLSGNIKVAAN